MSNNGCKDGHPGDMIMKYHMLTDGYKGGGGREVGI